MCLLTRNINQVPPLEPVRAWKVYGTMDSDDGKIVWYGFYAALAQRNVGQVITSDRIEQREYFKKLTKQSLDEVEARQALVDYGIHVFTDINDACSLLMELPHRILVEVEGHPDDFVARGLNSGRTDGMVFDKVTVKQVLTHEDVLRGKLQKES